MTTCKKEHSPNDPCNCTELPEGKTCAECMHVIRCVSMFGTKETDTECQWAPSRFKDSEEFKCLDEGGESA